MLAQSDTELREELLAQKGIGPETADSILLYAGQHPIFVVDAYTRRVLERHEAIARHVKYDDVRELVERALKLEDPASNPVGRQASDGSADPSALGDEHGRHDLPSPRSTTKCMDCSCNWGNTTAQRANRSASCVRCSAVLPPPRVAESPSPKPARTGPRVRRPENRVIMKLVLGQSASLA